MRRVLPVVVPPQEDGPGFLAIWPTWPGCHAEGDTVGAALDHVQAVAEALWALRREDGWPWPPPASGADDGGYTRFRREVAAVKERDVDTLILSAINTCWATPITMPTLLTLIREEYPPDVWCGPVGQLFAEVPVRAVQRWAAQHTLTPTQLARYYDRFVRTSNVLNPELERWWRGDLGHAL